MLMNHFKTHIRSVYPTMMHFLTYADNFAVGYFRKQGFTKDITLDRSVWAGYIKDYEGGTIMQCTLLPKVDYTRTRDAVGAQRAAVLAKIRQMSRSHIVHPGLPQFAPGAPAGATVDPQDVPGLRESGWTPDMVVPCVLAFRAPLSCISRAVCAVLTRAAQAEHARGQEKGGARAHAPPAFRPAEPLVRVAVPHAREPRRGAGLLRGDRGANGCARAFFSPSRPLAADLARADLATMARKLEADGYADLDAFLSDARLVFDNCRFYNPEDSIYAKSANKLEECLNEGLRKQHAVAGAAAQRD
jgi:histone acetyltransferase